MAFTRVQIPGTFATATATSVSQTYGVNNTAGNLLIAFVRQTSGSPESITGVIDTAGNTWQQFGSLNAGGLMGIFYCSPCLAGPNTVTASKSGPLNGIGISIAEYSGQFAAAPAGFATGPALTGANPANLILFTPQAGYLMVEFFTTNGVAVSWTNFTGGFTQQAGALGGSLETATWGDNTSSIAGVNLASITQGTQQGGNDFIGKCASFVPAGLTPIPGFNFVKTTEVIGSGTVSPTTCMFPGGNTAGNLILVSVVQFGTTTNKVTGVTDTAGNIYALLSSSFISDNANYFVAVYAANGCAGFKGNNTISAAFSAGAGTVETFGVEYSGQAASLLDTTANSHTLAGSSVSYGITPAASNELLFTSNSRAGGGAGFIGLGVQTDRSNVAIDGVTGGFVTPNADMEICDLLSSASGSNTITAGVLSTTGISSFTTAIKAATFGISGNAGVAGATVSWSGPSSGSVVADGSGNYNTGEVLVVNGNYTITPSLSGKGFSPSNRTVLVVADTPGINFTALATYSVPDDRNFSVFPNNSINVQGTLTYTVPAQPSVTPPVDSRISPNIPVDSRTATNVPQNSRTNPPF